MTRRASWAAALLLVATAGTASAQQDLETARGLYGAAKYEEALVVLDRLAGAGGPASFAVQQYRANCLLALNRREEADEAIAAIVQIDPLYVPGEDDAAPWVRTAFRTARQKVLPAALQRLYAEGRSAYARKDTEAATATLARVLALLDDPDLALDQAARADMRMVVQGFLDLLHTPAPPAAARDAGPPDPPPPDASAQPAKDPASPGSPRGTTSPAGQKSAVPAGDFIFDAASGDVVPPVPLKRDVPTWPYAPRPAPGTAAVVEIVVKGDGTIEWITVRQGAGRLYDQMIVQAAQNWLYRPATRAGQPVRYRLLVKVVIGTPPADGPR
jgi:TonB family protein